MIKSTGALLLFAALSAGQAMASDVAFRGNLLDRPCHVSGDSLNKHVVFKTRASGISGIRPDVRRQSRLSSGWKTAMQQQLAKL